MCASSARRVRTYDWLVLGFLVATFLRTLQIFIADVLFGTSMLIERLEFPLLAGISLALAVCRYRRCMLASCGPGKGRLGLSAAVKRFG